MITLQEINHNNYEDALTLKVKPDQEDFVVPVNHCIAEAYVDVMSGKESPILLVVCHNNEVVGFAEVGLYDVEEGEFLGEKFGDKKYYDFNRFLIDKDHQGKGFGRAATLAIIEFIKTLPKGSADCISLCYAATNEIARSLYLSTGFTETGEIGEEDEALIVYARLALSS